MTNFRDDMLNGRDDRKAVRLLVASGVTAVCLLALVISTSNSASGSAVASFAKSLVWPIFIMAFAIFFRSNVKSLFSVVTERVKRGSSIEFLGIKFGAESTSIETQAEKLPAPHAGEQITIENVALLHTSFYSESGTRRFANGLQYFQFEVIVIAPDSVVRRIKDVTYYLEDSWPQPLRTRTITDVASRFKMKELANGTSIVRAEIKFTDQDTCLWLNRFIDLRSDGPRI
jgi:hypothetical protein